MRMLEANEQLVFVNFNRNPLCTHYVTHGLFNKWPLRSPWAWRDPFHHGHQKPKPSVYCGCLNPSFINLDHKQPYSFSPN